MVTFAHAARLIAGEAATRVLRLVSHLRDALVEAHQVRARLEAELFRGRYRLSSKNDDDLPIVR
jgi:hypothetical protein